MRECSRRVAGRQSLASQKTNADERGGTRIRKTGQSLHTKGTKERPRRGSPEECWRNGLPRPPRQARDVNHEQQPGRKQRLLLWTGVAGFDGGADATAA